MGHARREIDRPAIPARSGGGASGVGLDGDHVVPPIRIRWIAFDENLEGDLVGSGVRRDLDRRDVKVRMRAVGNDDLADGIGISGLCDGPGGEDDVECHKVMEGFHG